MAHNVFSLNSFVGALKISLSFNFVVSSIPDINLQKYPKIRC